MSLLLKDFSNLTGVRLGKDRATGRSKGYAFVDFATGELNGGAQSMATGELNEGLSQWQLRSLSDQRLKAT